MSKSISPAVAVIVIVVLVIVIAFVGWRVIFAKPATPNASTQAENKVSSHTWNPYTHQGTPPPTMGSGGQPVSPHTYNPYNQQGSAPAAAQSSPRPTSP